MEPERHSPCSHAMWQTPADVSQATKGSRWPPSLIATLVYGDPDDSFQAICWCLLLEITIGSVELSKRASTLTMTIRAAGSHQRTVQHPQDPIAASAIIEPRTPSHHLRWEDIFSSYLDVSPGRS